MIPPNTPAGRLARALIVTAEVMGSELRAVAAEDMARELAEYGEPAVLEALRRCKRELAGRLTLAAVLARIDDGHLGADEAWALCPRSESESVVWTDQIAQAFGTAERLLAAGDQVAARMAFRESYTALVRSAREQHRPATWFPSLGHDPGGREAAIRAARDLGRLSAAQAAHLLPPPQDMTPLLPGGDDALSPAEIDALIAGVKLRRIK